MVSPLKGVRVGRRRFLGNVRYSFVPDVFFYTGFTPCGAEARAPGFKSLRIRRILPLLLFF